MRTMAAPGWRMLLRMLLRPVLLLAAVLAAACIGEEPESAEGTSYVQVGDMAPDFTVEMFDGGSVTLSEWRGEVVLLTFFASWCPTCREELADVQERVIDRFAGAPFRFLPVSRGESRGELAAYRAESGLSFPMGLDPDASIYGMYASRTVPRNYVIGRDGRVEALTAEYRDAEFEALLERIERLLE